ncbi:MAG: hypothetical protein NVS2B17_06860 [Candidatus Velthaea sp.]
MVRLHFPLKLLLAQAQPAPSPTALASKPRARKRSVLGEGPIEFSGRGSLDLTTRRQGRNGLEQGQSGYQGTMDISLERRTEAAVIGLRQGIGNGSGHTTLGQFAASYRTPKYTLDYGTIGGSSETQIQVGGFTRGLRYTQPRPNGSIELIGAAAFQTDSTGYRALGIRRSYQQKKSALAITAIAAAAQHGVGSNRIFDAFYKRYGETTTAAFELALSNPSSVTNIENGVHPAYGLAIDRQSRRGFISVNAQAYPSGFASIDSTQLPGDHVSFTARRDLGQATNVALNVGLDRARVKDLTNLDRRASLTLTTGYRGVTVTALENIATSMSGDQRTLNRSTGAIVSEMLFGTQISQSYQIATVDGSAGHAATNQLAFNESRSVGNGYLLLTQSFGKSTSLDALGTFRDNEFAYTRKLGSKLDLTLTRGDQTQATNGVATRTLSTSYSLTRRLSNVVALRVTATRARQAGPLGGTSTGFSADLVGPFNVGAAARAGGRANPNLPGTIRGRVYAIPSGTTYAFGQRGVGNVLVVLDGVLSQRSDANGEYEFRFVKAGTHTVALEAATLSPGIVSDRQSQTLKIFGGQMQSVDFGVGTFAAIGGRVFTKINGAVRGIPGVVLTVDGLQRVVTDNDGRYSVGRLAAGGHRVAVAIDTLPSNLSFEGGTAERTLQAVTGVTVQADFTPQSLGSIAGTVLYAPDNGFGDLRGARDVYVVANPGDHAAITGADGAFLLDNLPPGTYTLTLDKDTLPDGQSIMQGPDPVSVFSEAKVEGITFKLGAEAKEVVFTFNGAKKAPLSVSVEPSAVPPGAVARIIVKSGAKNLKGIRIESDVFGNFPLAAERDGVYSATFSVPNTVQKGEYSLRAALSGDETSVGDASLKIDPGLKLVSARTIPIHPVAGRSMRVLLRILADAGEGDEVRFSDGYTVKLPKPRGRVFALDLRLWSRGLPYSGSVIIKKGVAIPFVIDSADRSL